VRKTLGRERGFDQSFGQQVRKAVMLVVAGSRPFGRMRMGMGMRAVMAMAMVVRVPVPMRMGVMMMMAMVMVAVAQPVPVMMNCVSRRAARIGRMLDRHVQAGIQVNGGGKCDHRRHVTSHETTRDRHGIPIAPTLRPAAVRRTEPGLWHERFQRLCFGRTLPEGITRFKRKASMGA
jgi:hypothetical protein